jgi:hypothetical protein
MRGYEDVDDPLHGQLFQVAADVLHDLVISSKGQHPAAFEVSTLLHLSSCLLSPAHLLEAERLEIRGVYTKVHCVDHVNVASIYWSPCHQNSSFSFCRYVQSSPRHHRQSQAPWS